jgi:hypothetical protein
MISAFHFDIFMFHAFISVKFLQIQRDRAQRRTSTSNHCFDLGSYVMELVLIIGSDLLINIRILVFHLVPRRWPFIERFIQASNHCYMVSEFTDFS